MIQRTVIASLTVLTLYGHSILASPLTTEFTYQGQLKDAGSPANGSYDLRFQLFDAATTPPGVQIGSTVCKDNVAVDNGLFTVKLDFGASPFLGDARWLEVAVRADVVANNCNSGAYTTLSPRQPLTAAPYALFALSSASGGAGPWSTNGTHIFNANTGNVGIGTNSPINRLQVVQPAAGGTAVSGASSNFGGIGGYFQSDGTNGMGLYGFATAASGTTYAGRFDCASTSGTGVFGLATAATGITYGVQGKSASNSGYGVYGEATATSGINYGGYFKSSSSSGYGVYGQSADNAGVFGLATATSGVNYGVFGQSDSTIGFGLYGLATATSGNTRGVYARTDSDSGTSVYAFAAADTGTTYAFYGLNESSEGRAVYGRALASAGVNYGGYFESESPSGYGVYAESADNIALYGLASASSGVNYGVYGKSNSTSGYGIYGNASAAGGRAVFGTASAGTGFGYGGYFQCASTDGRAVFGNASAGTGVGFGGYFLSASTDGRAVFGRATAASGATYGGRFQSDSPDGYGAYGLATAPDGVGVVGGSSATNGLGYGGRFTTASTTGIGVMGDASAATGLNYGVYGIVTSPNGYGVFSVGDMAATGLKPFRIDHPSDPENKYLLHYAAEGPEPQNVYNGVITLNAEGQAWVSLPEYFAEINRDFRYQLTCIGEPALVYVKQEIADNRFLIAGGKPGQRVSWEVKGVRNDRWARTRGAPVEVEKIGIERGTYQHPELNGAPRERGLHFRRWPTIAQSEPVPDEAAPEMPLHAAGER